MTLTRHAFLAPLAAVLALAACTPPAKQPVLNIHKAETTLPAIKGNPAGVYFTITGGPQDVQLLAVLAPMAQRAEIHESTSENGVVSMKALTSVDIPAKGNVDFRRGGKHVMVWGINDAAAKAGTMPLTFVFSNNDRIISDVKINPAAAGGASGEGDHSKMDHDKMDMAPAKK